MNDLSNIKLPSKLVLIEKETKSSGFPMPSDRLTGSFLRTMAVTKPSGTFLDLGTGTGLSAAWILDGMDVNSTLLSIDTSKTYMKIAKKHLNEDSRVKFKLMDANDFLKQGNNIQFDFIFADAMPGKYELLEEALSLLKPNGTYIIDDMLPQSNWAKDHPPKVVDLIKKNGTKRRPCNYKNELVYRNYSRRKKIINY